MEIRYAGDSELLGLALADPKKNKEEYVALYRDKIALLVCERGEFEALKEYPLFNQVVDATTRESEGFREVIQISADNKIRQVTSGIQTQVLSRFRCQPRLKRIWSLRKPYHFVTCHCGGNFLLREDDFDLRVVRGLEERVLAVLEEEERVTYFTGRHYGGLELADPVVLSSREYPEFPPGVSVAQISRSAQSKDLVYALDTANTITEFALLSTGDLEPRSRTRPEGQVRQFLEFRGSLVLSVHGQDELLQFERGGSEGKRLPNQVRGVS